MSLKEKTDISPEVRRAVLERDSYDGCVCCTYCGKPLLHGGAHIHHCVRRSQGGEGTIQNLCVLCPACHTALHNGHSEIQARCVSYLEELYGKDRIE